MLYKYYLNSYEATDLDGITKMVSNSTDWLLKLFNYDVSVVKYPQKPWTKVILNGVYLADIIEGCNAVSVMILFVSFVAAFSGKLKETTLFIILGVLSIYVLNVIRIAFLTVLLFYFPKQNHLLHGVIFPLIIYGYVFILWIFWINRFSKYAK